MVKPLILEELNVKELELKAFKDVAALEGKGDYIVVSEAAVNSAIYTTLTEELKAEGIAREIVHRLQTMRRSAGFDIADHIITYYQGDDYIREVMENKTLGDYIKQETLSQQLTTGIPETIDFKESYKLGGHEVLLGVKRLG